MQNAEEEPAERRRRARVNRDKGGIDVATSQGVLADPGRGRGKE